MSGRGTVRGDHDREYVQGVNVRVSQKILREVRKGRPSAFSPHTFLHAVTCAEVFQAYNSNSYLYIVDILSAGSNLKKISHKIVSK